VRHSAAMGLALGLVLAACTSPKTQETPSPSASVPAPSASPSSAPASDIQFVMDDAYLAGDRVVVRVKNVGEVRYKYQFTYAACFLSYFDSNGRTFIIPPGTHCDIRGEAVIKPGEIKRLFTWDLDECVKDDWGCVKSRPLNAGTYTIRGTFKPVDRGSPARAEATFELRPSY
jgi:hypothetical protein